MNTGPWNVNAAVQAQLDNEDEWQVSYNQDEGRMHIAMPHDDACAIKKAAVREGVTVENYCRRRMGLPELSDSRDEDEGLLQNLGWFFYKVFHALSNRLRSLL